MHYVKSLETGNWWDSAKRIPHPVKPGTVVAFQDPADAEYFGDGKRGQPVAPNQPAEIAAEPSDDLPVMDEAPKPKRVRKAAADV